MWILGAAMTVPFILLSGPFAGYCISRFVLVKIFHGPDWLIPVFVALGFAASGIQVYQLIQRIQKIGSQKDT